MIRTYGLTHLSLAVKDLERTLRFYRKVFGAKVYWREEGSAQVKTPGCHDVIAFEERKRGVGKTGGINHFGFRLVEPNDIDKAVKDAVAAGGKLLRRGDFAPGVPYADVSPVIPRAKPEGSLPRKARDSSLRSE